VVVDSHLQTPLDAALFIAGRPLWIWAAGQNDVKASALQAQGATVFHRPDAAGKVDLKAMMRDLAQREINELHVEAGHKLNGSLIRAGLVDEFLVYLAPKMIGQGTDMSTFGPLTALSQAVPLVFNSVDRIGPDLRIVARVTDRDKF